MAEHPGDFVCAALLFQNEFLVIITVSPSGPVGSYAKHVHIISSYGAECCASIYVELGL